MNSSNPSSRSPTMAVRSITPAEGGQTSAPPALKTPIRPSPHPQTLAGPSAGSEKEFLIADWSGQGEGEKIVLYAKSGAGKTTLSAQIPDAVFIGLDDGGRKIVNPLTNKPIRAIRAKGPDGEPASMTFDDVKSMLVNTNLFPEKCTIVIDNITCLQTLGEKKLAKAKGKPSFKEIGWDGGPLLSDLMRGVLADLERYHIRKGRNVVLIAQEEDIIVSNPEGGDYREYAPKLMENKICHIRTDTVEWSDHVFRIGYRGLQITTAEGATVGKASMGADGLQRVVFTTLQPTFVAKTRPLSGGRSLPGAVSFETRDDDSLWQMIFHGAEAG